MDRPLPPRLAAVAALVPAGLPVADIGTDHGQLPCWLVRTGQVPRAVAIDDKAAPLARARALVARRGLAVDVRQGWGCRPLREGEVATLTLAGLGGALITGVLAGMPAGVTHLVLQPNTEAASVRAWLHASGWRVHAERALLDGSRWFTTLAATRVTAGDAGDAPPDAVDLAWGRADRHLDPAALLTRLDAEEARLARLPGEAASGIAGRRLIATARERARRAAAATSAPGSSSPPTSSRPGPRSP